jgi:hypothetical protein
MTVALIVLLILAAFVVSDSKVGRWCHFGFDRTSCRRYRGHGAGIAAASVLKVYHATAGLTACLTLATVVARAVSASGKVTFPRIIGAILLYLTIGLIFVGLFSLVALLEPDSFKDLEQKHEDLASSRRFCFARERWHADGHARDVEIACSPSKYRAPLAPRLSQN